MYRTKMFKNNHGSNTTIIEERNLEDKITMSRRNNRQMVPEAREAMNRFKMEVANEVGVNLKDGYNGDLTSREAGSVGGGMVKNMIKAYEQSLASQK